MRQVVTRNECVPRAAGSTSTQPCSGDDDQHQTSFADTPAAALATIGLRDRVPVRLQRVGGRQAVATRNT